ncbi:MAG: response regulator [Bacteroidota bacterium]|nr:response regulator [Bacteroidota bacterium]MDX5429913.1 response regulator [Bacteroidota bacterium]MDX5468687.1 response regulator [Bacteroidota bacterium]
MANIVLQYLKKSVNPGGSPTRLKEWAGFILLTQVLVLFLENVIHKPFDLPTLLVNVVFIQVWTFWFVRREKAQVRLLNWFIYTGLAIQVVAVYYTDAEIAGTIYFMVWSSIALLSERRGYVSLGFGLFFFLLIFSGITLTLYAADDRTIDSPTSIATFSSAIVFVLFNFYLLYIDYKADKLTLENMQLQFQRLDSIASNMADILNRKEPINELLWRVTQRCIPLLNLEDFVIYLYQPESGKLVQVAAIGEKSGQSKSVINPIELEPGKGIVGRCFETGRPVLVNDTRLDSGYIVDDRSRLSELAVPIYSENTVVGVLDSEHSEPGFFSKHHLQVFEIIASFCGVKLTDDRAKDQLREAEGAREMAEQFKELDDMKNRFISNISHDLKTPLSLIKGPIQQIIRKSTDADVLKNAGYIQKNTGHLLNMVEQLLQLQRLDHGLKSLYPERFQLCDVIQPLMEQFESLIEKKQIHLEVERCQVILFADRFKLQQCVHNLLQNAFKYTPEGGKVSLKIFRIEEEGDLCIEVKDTGPGISPEHGRRIFDRFYKTDVNNHEGTGIGLSLVKEYMEMIGGQVDYRPNPEGGSCFTLLFNKKMLDEVEKEHAEMEALVRTDIPVILVVEDHPELNEFIAGTLRNDYQVIQAFDGEQAWKITQEEFPDLILADLMLPKMQGEELLKKVKDEDATAHIPVVILSSKSKVPDKVELYGLGAENYLVKPFDSDELLAVIKNCFDRRKQLQKLLSEQGINLSTSIAKKPENEWLDSILNLIKENIDSPELSGGFICDSLGIGRNRLQRDLKALTGLSPAEFIRYVRLEEAKTLLETSQLTVSEVAYSVGFNNLSYFTRSFKSQYDVLPSELSRTSEV